MSSSASHFAILQIARLAWIVCAPAGCTPEQTEVGPTQVTARVQVNEPLRAHIHELAVSVFSEEKTVWRLRDERRYASEVLRWPLDLTIVPGPGASHAGRFELIVQARDRQAAVLVERRAIVAFTPRRQTLLELSLQSCAGLSASGRCESDPNCHGEGCLSCEEGVCAQTTVQRALPSLTEPYDASTLITEVEAGGPSSASDAGALLDAAPQAGSEGEMDGQIAPAVVVPPIGVPEIARGPDAGASRSDDAALPQADGSSSPLADATLPGLASCATPGSGIVCTPSSACGGGEVCDPSSAQATSTGCAPVATTCPAGTTCDLTLGTCTPCLLRPDADGDGVPAQQCGGSDCDDSDPARAPGQAERCNGKDDDCSGAIDDGAELCPAIAQGVNVCSGGSCVANCAANHDLTSGGCVPHDFCAGVSACGPGQCRNLGSSYACICPQGYDGSDSDRCTPVDPCAVQQGGCSHACTMTAPGVATCSCPPPLLLAADARTCEAADPCAVENGSCSHLCTRTGPSERVCSCPAEQTLQADQQSCVPSCALQWSRPEAVVADQLPKFAQFQVSTNRFEIFFCRGLQADGARVPGGTVGRASETLQLQPACGYAPLTSSGEHLLTAQGIPSRVDGQAYELFTPGPSCAFRWVARDSANGALPAHAVPLGWDANRRPLYGCRVAISDGTSTGQSLGTLLALPGAPCVVTRWSQLYFGAPFEVLVAGE